MRKFFAFAAAVAALFSLNSCDKFIDVIDNAMKNYIMGEQVIFIESAKYETTTMQGFDKQITKFTFVGKGSTREKPVEMSIMFPSSMLSNDIPAEQLVYSATNGSGSVDIVTGDVLFSGNLAGRFGSEPIEDAEIEGTISVKHFDSTWTIESSGFEIVFADGTTYNLNFGYIGKVEEEK